jgi:hypothetical protein
MKKRIVSHREKTESLKNSVFFVLSSLSNQACYLGILRNAISSKPLPMSAWFKRSADYAPVSGAVVSRGRGPQRQFAFGIRGWQSTAAE